MSAKLPTSRPQRIVAAIGIALVVALLLLPVSVTRNARRYSCGTLASSPFKERQYPRLYGNEAGRDCQRELKRNFVIYMVVIVGIGIVGYGVSLRTKP
jgi:hypothetical protein